MSVFLYCIVNLHVHPSPSSKNPSLILTYVSLPLCVHSCFAESGNRRCLTRTSLRYVTVGRVTTGASEQGVSKQGLWIWFRCKVPKNRLANFITVLTQRRVLKVRVGTNVYTFPSSNYHKLEVGSGSAVRIYGGFADDPDLIVIFFKPEY